MKTSRILIVVLSLLVLWLGYLQLSKTRTPAAGPSKDLWHTNTVNLWHTNTVTQWRTNTAEMWRTNTVVQNFTNEIVREVPAKLSPAAREAATAGYRYLNAPLAASASDALYKAPQIAVEVNTKACDRTQVAEDAATIKKNVEAALRAQGVATGDGSPLIVIGEAFACIKSGAPVGKLDDHRGIDNLGGFQHSVHAVGAHHVHCREGELFRLGNGKYLLDIITGNHARFYMI